MVSWEEVIYVSALDLWTSWFMWPWLKHRGLLRHALSVTQLENHTGGTSVSVPSTWSAKRQQDYAKSCHFISVSLSRNVLFSYGPEYGFFSTAVTSGFWVV